MTKWNSRLVAGLLAAISMGSPWNTALAETKITRVAVSNLGTIPSPDGKCSVKLEIAPYGGYDVLSYGEPRGQVEDVTAVVWISPARLAYSVSPIYGKPGIYIFDCTNKSTVQIRGPKTHNSGYPDGADYFELKEVRDGQILRFYYAPDVEMKITFDGHQICSP